MVWSLEPVAMTAVPLQQPQVTAFWWAFMVNTQVIGASSFPLLSVVSAGAHSLITPSLYHKRTMFKTLICSKTCLKRPLKYRQKKKIQTTNGSILKVGSIAECSPWSILQCFWPALSDNWSWKPIFGLYFWEAVLDRFYCITDKSLNLEKKWVHTSI